MPLPESKKRPGEHELEQSVAASSHRTTTYSSATKCFVCDHDGSMNWGLKNLSTSDDGTIPFGANPATDAGREVHG